MARAQTDKAIALPDSTLDYWFKTENRQALQALRRAIGLIRDEDYRRFFLVSLSSIVRRTSLADPSIPPPVKLSRTRAERLKGRYGASFEHAAALDSRGVFSLFETAITSNIHRMQELEVTEGLGTAEILSSECEAAATRLADESVDLVITFPPYCGAQKYIRSVRLELLTLGFGNEEIATADQRTLGTERVTSTTPLPDRVSIPLCGQLYQKIRRENPTRARIFFSYVSYLQKFAHELNRILTTGADAFVTLGTDHVAGNRVDCAKIFAHMASEVGLTHVCTLIDSIPSRGMSLLKSALHSSMVLTTYESLVFKM